MSFERYLIWVLCMNCYHILVFRLVNTGLNYPVRRVLGFSGFLVKFSVILSCGMKALVFMSSSTFIKCWILDRNVDISYVLFFSSWSLLQRFCKIDRVIFGFCFSFFYLFLY